MKVIYKEQYSKGTSVYCCIKNGYIYWSAHNGFKGSKRLENLATDKGFIFNVNHIEVYEVPLVILLYLK